MAYYCYILTNKNKTVLYVGATNNLQRRIYEHKTKYYPKSFTAKYNCYNLMYYEVFDMRKEAFNRETQLKTGNRKRKISLIESINPEWKDLAGSFATLGKDNFEVVEIW
jgi:putative endonuclease